MKPVRFRCAPVWVILFAAAFILAACRVHGAILYKSYVVKKDRGREVLCDPYIVSEKDAVFPMLRQKGELAAENFTEFLHLFKRLNPHIRDLNRIRPGAHIFIPIRKLPPGEFAHQPGMRVTIPFVTISKVKKLIREHADTHRIQRGECVSVLVARRFGAFGTDAYRLGIDLFRRANPGITDLNRVFVGQKVYVPRATIPEQPWFPAVLDDSGTVMEAEAYTTLEPAPTPRQARSAPTGRIKGRDTPLGRAAALLNARLIQKGRYFFPAQQGPDFELDLTRFPILETKDGKKVLLCETPLDDEMVYAIRAFWEDAQILRLSREASLETVLDTLARALPGIAPHQNLHFSDGGLKAALEPRWLITRPGSRQNPVHHTAVFLAGGDAKGLPAALIRYFSKRGVTLKKIDSDPDAGTKRFPPPEASTPEPKAPSSVIHIRHETPHRVLPELVSALGYAYTQNVSVFFPYGGIQVKAWTDMIALKNGKMLLADFGNLQGDAVKALSGAGLPVLQFTPNTDKKHQLKKLLDALPCRVRVNPIFPDKSDPNAGNVSLTFPGVLILTDDENSTLITHDGIDADALAFLQEKGIQVVTVPESAGWM